MGFEVTGGYNQQTAGGGPGGGTGSISYLKFSVDQDGPVGYGLPANVLVFSTTAISSADCTVRLGWPGEPQALMPDTFLPTGEYKTYTDNFCTSADVGLEVYGIAGTVTFIVYYQPLPI